MARVYEAHAHVIRRRCARIFPRSADANDLFQEVFLKLLRSGGALLEAESKAAYIYTVVDRCAIDLIRKRSRFPMLAFQLIQDAVELCAPAPPLEERSRIAAMLAGLSPQERLIALHHYEGRTQSEISEVTGLSRQTVNKKLKSIRARVSQIQTMEDVGDEL